MASERLYSATALCKDYQMGQVTVPALREVSLEVEDGEFLVILGPSGSGKSTLLNILGGMDGPSSGSVRFRGTELAGLSPARLTAYRREHVGFVFQFFHLVPTLTALENVQLATEISRSPAPAAEMLGLVGLSERRDHFPSQLSGGEQQRVAIARAVAKQPDVLLCDEPTGALDYETGKTVLSVLRKVHRERETTVILVTHNASIGDMADRVVRMRSGAIQEVHTNRSPVEPEDLKW